MTVLKRVLKSYMTSYQCYEGNSFLIAHPFIFTYHAAIPGYANHATQYKNNRNCKNQTPQIFLTKIPRKGSAQHQSQFPQSCICERFIYSHDPSAYSAAGIMSTYPGNIQIAHRHMKDEGGNWDRGRAIPFLGIHKWDFLCSVRHSFVLFISLTSISSSVTDSPMKRIIMANSRRSMNPFPS
jgi:hypothetical protein